MLMMAFVCGLGRTLDEDGGGEGGIGGVELRQHLNDTHCSDSCLCILYSYL